MRHQEPVKIQINSLEALERLIGGDPSLDFDIRNNVAQKFAAKHLKAFANSETMKGMEKQIKEMIWTNPGGYQNKLKPEFKKSVESEVSTIFDGIVKNKLKKLEQDLYDKMNKELEKFTNKIADDITKVITHKNMQDIINKKVDHRIKTMMKMLVEQDDPNQIVNTVEDLK